MYRTRCQSELACGVLDRGERKTEIHENTLNKNTAREKLTKILRAGKGDEDKLNVFLFFLFMNVCEEEKRNKRKRIKNTPHEGTQN